MVVFGHVAEGGQAFAEPHGHFTVHVDGEGLEALLQATHGVVLKGAGVLPQIHTAHLRQTQTTDRDETWKTRDADGDLTAENDHNMQHNIQTLDRFVFLMSLSQTFSTIK